MASGEFSVCEMSASSSHPDGRMMRETDWEMMRLGVEPRREEHQGIELKKAMWWASWALLAGDSRTEEMSEAVGVTISSDCGFCCLLSVVDGGGDGEALEDTILSCCDQRLRLKIIGRGHRDVRFKNE